MTRQEALDLAIEYAKKAKSSINVSSRNSPSPVSLTYATMSIAYSNIAALLPEDLPKAPGFFKE